VGKRVYFGGLCGVFVDTAQTSKGVDTINVHGARTANAFSARSPESQCWVGLVLDLDLNTVSRYSLLRKKPAMQEGQFSCAAIGRREVKLMQIA
jgi:hypothetical protein